MPHQQFLKLQLDISQKCGCSVIRRVERKLFSNDRIFYTLL